MNPLEDLTEAVKNGDRKEAIRLTEAAIEANTPAERVVDALVTGMDDVGRRFKDCEIFVPEVLIASRAMKQSMAILEPILAEAGIKPEFKAVIGTVRGDLHDIGKNLVSMMWTGSNIDVVDLGTDVPPETFVEAAKEENVRAIGLSALLTTTMVEMKTVIQACREAEVGDVKIIVGGAPITQKFADEIGADGFAPDAATAVDILRDLVHA
jgi:5-methyltetrahydrofolate--homocysteine methyltransferase